LDGGSGVTVQPHHIPPLTVIVNKDENGYGMKVSGDKPVYVQSVKEGKSAFGTSFGVYFVEPACDVLPETVSKRRGQVV
jgi:hypothetical protein